MKIVILDGGAVNKGDLSWDKFAALGELTAYDYTPAELTLERAANAEIVITNKCVLSAEIIAALPKLKYIGLLSTGANVVDCEFAASRGIPVCNVPNYCTAEVAQHTFALLLELTNACGLHSNCVHGGEWQRSKDFCFWRTPLISLCGKTLGIIGFGATGRAVCNIALAMGMRVIINARRTMTDLPDGVLQVSQDDLFAQSDVISLHCPLTPETKGLINAANISKMKDGVIIINTARGPIIDESALADALNSGKVGGAGVDVLEIEPPVNGSPLIGAKNCIITPHIAWASKEARARLADIACDNLIKYLEGKPQNIVNL